MEEARLACTEGGIPLSSILELHTQVAAEAELEVAHIPRCNNQLLPRS